MLKNLNINFIGDTHFQNEDLNNKLQSYNNTTFIHVGDFNIGCKSFYEEEKWLKILNDTLISINSTMYIIRGNHDDPNYFTDDIEFFKKHLKSKYNCFHYKCFIGDEYKVDTDEYSEFIFGLSNIKFVPDYTVLNINGNNLLCVGGAISIDRKQHIKRNLLNIKYYKDEVFKYSPEKVKDLTDIDIVVTHNSPSFCEPKEFNDIVYHFYNDGDVDLLRDLQHERNDLKLLHDILIKNNDLNLWVNGHFHMQTGEYIGNTLFRTVAILEFFSC